MSSTPAGLHEKRIERSIQTLKGRYRALLASLPYELPAKLHCEAYLYAMNSMNMVPNKQTGPSMSPYLLVRRERPKLPLYYFGQTGIFYTQRQDSPDLRGEWGILLGQGDSPNYLRAYIPMRDGVYSKRKFIPHPEYPPEWNLLPRIRPHNQQTANRFSLPPTTPSAPSSSPLPSSLNTSLQHPITSSSSSSSSPPSPSLPTTTTTTTAAAPTSPTTTPIIIPADHPL
eukprot:scaffold2284_cov212-Ochromonas_danica.AAC.1